MVHALSPSPFFFLFLSQPLYLPSQTLYFRRSFYRREQSPELVKTPYVCQSARRTLIMYTLLHNDWLVSFSPSHPYIVVLCPTLFSRPWLPFLALSLFSHSLYFLLLFELCFPSSIKFSFVVFLLLKSLSSLFFFQMFLFSLASLEFSFVLSFLSNFVLLFQTLCLSLLLQILSPVFLFFSFLSLSVSICFFTLLHFFSHRMLLSFFVFFTFLCNYHCFSTFLSFSAVHLLLTFLPFLPLTLPPSSLASLTPCKRAHNLGYRSQARRNVKRSAKSYTRYYRAALLSGNCTVDG